MSCVGPEAIFLIVEDRAREQLRMGAEDKMIFMANLTLIYGLRLLPEGEIAQTPGAIQDATLKLANGHEAHVTMHVLEGSREEIEGQLRMSIDAFFDFYPEI